MSTKSTPPAPGVDPYAATTPLPRAAAPSVAATQATPAPEAPIAIEGLSLATKIFLGVAGTVALVLALTLVVGGVQSRRAAESSLRAELQQTSHLITDQLESDEDNLVAKARIYLSSPIGVGPVIEANSNAAAAGEANTSDMWDQANVIASQLGASWVQLTDASGIRLAQSDQQGAPTVDLSESPLVAGALGGEPVRGFGIRQDSILFDAVAVPVIPGQRVVGVAMLARNIGDSSAARVKRLTGSEVIYFALTSGDSVRIVGATDFVEDRPATARFLTGLIRGTDGDSTSLAELVGGMPVDSVIRSTAARVDEIDGKSYVWTLKPLLTAAGTVVGGVIALRDRDEALAPFRKMQNAVLLAGAVALLLAVLISYTVAQQITRPVRGLVGAARRAAGGDYAAAIPSARGEIGVLSGAISQLLADLREKQALVDFLQAPATPAGQTAAAGGATLAGTAARPGARLPGATLTEGQVLAGRYIIKRVLGAGGMGMVYKALDRELGETVAIKTLLPQLIDQDPAALDRFRSEIRLARRISHRNVVRTHDIGEADGIYFITMEFVEGSSLKDLIISRGRLPANAVTSIGKQLCRALDVAHEAGVIHRDIKPQNMVVEADGTLKVMDFGIARLQTKSDGHTRAGMVVGTPEYMSPEQLRGDDLDGRADLYSASAALYEALTGQLPLTAETVTALIGKVLTEKPVPPRTIVADAPATLSSAIMRGLEKDRELRPKTAADFLAILDRS